MTQSINPVLRNPMFRYFIALIIASSVALEIGRR